MTDYARFKSSASALLPQSSVENSEIIAGMCTFIQYGLRHSR